MIIKKKLLFRKKGLFGKKLFIDNGQPHGTVGLNWHGIPEREFIFFAEAFHLVAKDTVDVLRQNPDFGLGLDDNPVEHFRAYPIVFLYRHALELYMKAVILAGAPMVKINGMGEIKKNDLKTHQLKSLMKHLMKVFKAYGWEWDFHTPHFQSQSDFQMMIDELHSVDKEADAFRYPLDKKDTPSLYKYTRFNLFWLCEIMDNLLPVLKDLVGTAQELSSKALAEVRHDG